MHHDHAGVTGEPELFFQRLNRFGALLGREPMRRFGTHRCMIERLLAARADRIGVHLYERTAQILRDGAANIDERDLLVFLGVAEMRRKRGGTGARLALDNHGARPRAFRIASRTSASPRRAASISFS